MFESAASLYLYVESPLHAGVGFQARGPVDLPIQRDATTEHPLIRASSLKGAFRDLARSAAPPEEVVAAFGPEPADDQEAQEPDDEETFAGALVLGDARLLLFPLRALQGVFTWVTSADVLSTMQRTATGRGLALTMPPVVPPPDGAAWVGPKNRAVNAKGQLVLEEYTFEAKPVRPLVEMGRWFGSSIFPQDETYNYWTRKVQTDLAVVSEEAFRHFVTTRTEVIHRIRIDPETGTAAPGALWTEEFLPSDAVLYCPVAAQAPVQPTERLKTAGDVLAWFKALLPDRVQLGGGRTLGRGIVRLRWDEGAAPS
jgi:CRISPR-associated protein Cmr4